MRILFRDSSCAVPSLGCVVADSIGYDADEGTLWFSSEDIVWSVVCSETYANGWIRDAFRHGYVDLSDFIFDILE